MSKQRRGHKRKPKGPRQRINGQQGEDLIEEVADSSTVKGAKPKPSRKKVEKKRGGDTGELLTNPNQVQADARLIQRAVRGRWGVRRKGMIRRRLEEVVQKQEVQEWFGTKEGPVSVPSASLADKNAVAAARVLVAMDSMDQADDHFEIKNKAPSGTTVNVFNHLEPGQSRILQLAQSLGATELIIDGAAVPTSKSVGQPPEARAIQPATGKPVGEDSALAKARRILEAE